MPQGGEYPLMDPGRASLSLRLLQQPGPSCAKRARASGVTRIKATFFITSGNMYHFGGFLPARPRIGRLKVLVPEK